jgi:DNA-binding NarL/FixJ family response regulator
MLAQGLAGWLPKPLSLDNLAQALNNVLQS